MKVRSHHIATFLLAGAIFLSASAWFGAQAPTAFATCGTGANINVVAPPAGATLAGVFQIAAATGTSSTQPTGVTFTITAPSQVVIGNGTLQTTSGAPQWVYGWDTTTIPDGSFQLTAIAHYGTNVAADCNSTPVPITIHNAATGGTKTPTLAVAIAPNTWQGTPGQKVTFNVTGTYTNQYGTAYPVTSASGATFVWGTGTGSLAGGNSPSVTLTVGTAIGTYNVGVNVSMSGLTKSASALVKVVAPATAATPTPAAATPSSTTPASPAPTSTTTASGVAGTAPLTTLEIQQLMTSPTVFRPIVPTNSAPVVSVGVLGCLKAKIGADYSSISSGQTQPTVDDRLRGTVCFSGADKIPASMAPVAPNHLTELPTTANIVTVASIKNMTITNAKGDKVTAILLSGAAAPNSSVYLYFFSDPMVLRAETDSSGKWSYTLQNPLKPGKHEVYAVAAKDTANFVRTPALPIAIAAAASGDQNGSLVLESRFQPAQIGFILASGVMVIVAIIIMLLLRRRTKVSLVPGAAQTAPALIEPAAAPASPSTSPAVPVDAGTVVTPAPPDDHQVS